MGESFFDKFKAKENGNANGESFAFNEENKTAHDSVSEFAEARDRLNSETADEMSVEVGASGCENQAESCEEYGNELSEESEANDISNDFSTDFSDDCEKDVVDFSTDDIKKYNFDGNDEEVDPGDDEEVNLGDDEEVNLGENGEESESANVTENFGTSADNNDAEDTITSIFGSGTLDSTAAPSSDEVANRGTELAAEPSGEQTSETSAEDLKEQYKQRKIANLFSKIDMDCTMPNLSSAEIADCAEQAKLYGLSSVCILASRMKMFRKQSQEQNFCAVIAYPSGEMTEKSKICEIREAAKHGAREIDVFFRISALKDEKRKQIIKSLKKYRFVIGKKKVFKISVDSTLITADEAEFIAEAARDAKIDYIVVRNCQKTDERTKLFYSGLCAGKCKLEFAECVEDLSTAEKLTAIGAERFLLKNALSVADGLREEINKE